MIVSDESIGSVVAMIGSANCIGSAAESIGTSGAMIAYDDRIGSVVAMIGPADRVGSAAESIGRHEWGNDWL